MKICVLASCRPNIIKQYGLIKECIAQGLDYYILATGQHYDGNMFGNFFKELGLPREHINLGANGTNRIERMTDIMRRLQTVRNEPMYRPDIVIVQGDTDSDFVVALVAKMMGIRLAHNEAGIRSNSDIPEEYNRRMIDQIADMLFVPTKKDYDRIHDEGIRGDIYLTGNTVCDCVNDQVKDCFNGGVKYIFMTLHRNTNVDNPAILKLILEQTQKLKEQTGLPIIFSIHPRTEKMIDRFELRLLLKDFVIMKPLSYLNTIKHINGAELIITDSGGIQEECCVLKKKCIIVRDSTERQYYGSLLRRGDMIKTKQQLDEIDEKNIINIFNPIKHTNISKEILSLIIEYGE